MIIKLIVMNLENYTFKLPSIKKNKYRPHEKISKKLIFSIESNKVCNIYKHFLSFFSGIKLIL